MVIEKKLLDFGTDLTQLAREGKLDKVWGRDEEINRAAQLLCRRKKNNVLLIGEPGVGKTSIAEGIALRIIDKNISWSLQDKTVFSLDLAALVAGTQYRGQMEQRVKMLLDYLRENPNIILFIDEIHSIIDGGNSSNGVSIANMLKPALSKGYVQCIGATTLDEARKHFDKDAALSRRFQRVTIDQPSIAETVRILQNCKSDYEAFHGVSYSDELIERLPVLASKYITDRFLPDSAIDLMDEAGSKVHLENSKIPSKVTKLKAELETLTAEKMRLVKANDWQAVPTVKKECDRVSEELDLEQMRVAQQRSAARRPIEERDVLNIVASLSKVPLEKLKEEGIDKVLEVEQGFEKLIIGQDAGKRQIIKALKRSLIGLNNKNKPVFSALFLGKTGVGKTQMVKVLADKWYNGQVIRMDMSEYAEKISSTALVGAPPGYVGYDNGGKLTEQVKRNPYSLILLDEIEKAHPEVLNFLLQILDAGHITDGQGKKVDFTNTMIIMTSNLGCKEATTARGLGFGANEFILQDKSLDAAKKFFSPELWNRMDEQVVFESLTPEHIEKIVDLNLTQLKAQLAETGYRIKVNKKVKEYLSKKGFSAEYGARYLERTIRSLLLDDIADFILNNPEAKQKPIVVSLNAQEQITLKLGA